MTFVLTRLVVGAPISGYISDRIITHRRKTRGVWVPEDRLRGVQFSLCGLIPASLLIAGYATTYINGPLGLSLNLFALFINGFGVRLLYFPLSQPP